MYYLNSRYYNPDLCRFINVDAILSNSFTGYNLYTYCGNNPVNMYDTDGYLPAIAIFAGLGATLAYVTPILIVGGVVVAGATAFSLGYYIGNNIANAIAKSSESNSQSETNVTNGVCSATPNNNGWIKMFKKINGIEIHFVYNTITKVFDDFKFK